MINITMIKNYNDKNLDKMNYSQLIYVKNSSINFDFKWNLKDEVVLRVFKFDVRLFQMFTVL